MQMRRDVEYNLHKYLSNTYGGVQVLPPKLNHLIPFYLYSPGGMLCVSASIGWCRTYNSIQ